MTGLVVDAFGGPGGASEGMRQLGIDSIGIEWDAAACATRAAAGHRTIRADVARFPLERLVGRVAGLWMSPPCPTFSTAGKGDGREEMAFLHAFTEGVWKRGWSDPWDFHNWSDPRTPLVLEPLRWVETLRPEWVALEQVPPVLELWESYCAVWQDAGYRVWCGVLNAADYGVPQTRKRAVLLARRDGRTVLPPTPTHDEDPTPDLFGPGLLRWVSMADALRWVPPTTDAPAVLVDTGNTRGGSRSEGRSREIAKPSPVITSRGDQMEWRLNPGLTATQPNRRRYDLAEPAPTIAFGHDAAGWQWEKPATTVCGDPRISSRCHHDGSQSVDAKTTEQVRAGDYEGHEGIKLTEAEAAVLQSFPADYPWQGIRTKRWQQIGNAVPPRLARAVVAALASSVLSLEGETRDG